MSWSSCAGAALAERGGAPVGERRALRGLARLTLPGGRAGSLAHETRRALRTSSVHRCHHGRLSGVEPADRFRGLERNRDRRSTVVDSRLFLTSRRSPVQPGTAHFPPRSGCRHAGVAPGQRSARFSVSDSDAGPDGVRVVVMRRARGSPGSRGCAQHVRHRSSMFGHSLSEVTASAPRLPIGLDHGCAAKTWATAPPLKTVVLIGSMVSGAMKIRSPAPRTTGWMTRRYSSIKPVSTSDRANRTPP